MLTSDRFHDSLHDNLMVHHSSRMLPRLGQLEWENGRLFINASIQELGNDL
jgi:hypothetical protein